MKKFLSLIASLAISASAFTYNFQQGWQLDGALSDMNLSQFKNTNVVSVWTYDYKNQKWMAYFPNQIVDLSKYGIEPLINIKKGEGFWVNAAGSFSINVPDDQKAYEQGYQDGYNQGYQDGLNNSSNNANVENNSSNNNVNNNDSYLSTHLIDNPTDFNLTDIAGKTFKILDKNGNIVDVAFDNNGEATVTLSSGTYNAKYENGVINVYKDNKLKISMQKIKGDNNGFVTLNKSFHYDMNDSNYITNEDLDALMTNINPVDMSTLNYPITLYNSWGDKITLDNNGTIEMLWGEDENYTIQNGKVMVYNHWKNNYYDENNNSITSEGDQVITYQIIDTIDRYYVVEEEYNTTNSDVYSNLKGKTFNDIMDTNVSINWFRIDSNGHLLCSNKPEDKDTNYTKCGTYQEINSTAIKTKSCDPDGNDCWYSVVTIDPNTGKVTTNWDDVDTEIYSTSPIIKDNQSEAYRKSPMNLKQYIKLKMEKARKKIF